MKLMICGYGRHGKDTVAEWLVENCRMQFVSSSFFMADKVVLPKIRDMWQEYERIPGAERPEIGPYATLSEAYEDHR